MSTVRTLVYWLDCLAFAVPAWSRAGESKPASGAPAKAQFAAGCFWYMEPPHDKLPPVISTIFSEDAAAILHHDDAQRGLAETARAALSKTKTFKRDIVTEIARAQKFYPAEECQQNDDRNPARYPFIARAADATPGSSSYGADPGTDAVQIAAWRA